MPNEYIFFTIPLTILPFLDKNLFITIFLSSSFILCIIICFADCAVILLKLIDFIFSSIISPNFIFLYLILALLKGILLKENNLYSLHYKLIPYMRLKAECDYATAINEVRIR
jgi:hypothetical protein